MHSPKEASDHDVLAPQAESLPLGHFVRTVRIYRLVIVVSIAVVMLAFALIALLIFQFSPADEVTTLPFRLAFEGANRGEYPNGMKFSTAEISSDPVLDRVYKDNHLSVYLGPNDFSRSIVVLESNRLLEQLMLEYQGKLSDPKLTPVDRERLEKEFDQKRMSISKSDYSISFVQQRGAKRIPPTIVKKALAGVLTNWARHASIDKGVLRYRIPVLSVRILDAQTIQQGNPLIALAILRSKLLEAMQNIQGIGKIPGAELVRTRKESLSLSEIKLNMEDILKFEVEPAMMAARTMRLGEDAAEARRFLEAQLAYDSSSLAAARLNESAFRRALEAYQAKTQVQESPDARETSSRPQAIGEAVTPQINDSFIDRIVDMSNRNADREYRQRLVNDIREASLAVIPLEVAVAYDRALIEALQLNSGGGNDVTIAEVREQLKHAYDGVSRAMVHSNEIYLTASSLVNPETELYQLSGPPVRRLEQSMSLSRLVWWGAFVFLMAIPLVIGLCVLYDRARAEERMEEEGERFSEQAVRENHHAASPV